MASMPDPTDNSPADETNPHGWAVKYRRDGATCAACGEDTDSVHIELGGKPHCTECLDGDVLETWIDLADALDRLDTTLALAPSDNRPALLDDTIRILFEIADVYVPGGRDELLPDRIVCDEIVRRRPDEMPQEFMWQVIKALVPDITGADIAHLGEAAQIRHTRMVAEQHGGEVALLLLAHAGAGPDSQMTIREAVDHLGVDANRFFGLVITACAKAGCGPRDLPVDDVNDLLAAAKTPTKESK